MPLGPHLALLWSQGTCLRRASWQGSPLGFGSVRWSPVHQGSAPGEDDGGAEGPGRAPGHPRGYQGRAHCQPVKVEPMRLC